MKTIIAISALFTFGIFLSNAAMGEDSLPRIDIVLENGNTIDLDSGIQYFRATVDIENYDPSDGYHFMKVTRLSDNEVIKDTEILPKKSEEDLYSVKILHYIDTTLPDEELLGDYELEIYSEFGPISAGTQFSIIKSSLPQISTNSTDEVLAVATSEDAIESDEPPEDSLTNASQIPDWIRNIFVWYADGTITETDLLSALEFLINQGIIDVEN